MGGKSRLASVIIPRLPNHITYVEPFCGGCAVFFNKPRASAEVLNDADSRLVNLLRVFRYHPEELLKELHLFTHSRQEFRDAVAQPGYTDIQRAARFYFVLKSSFACEVNSPTFGYGLTGKAKFNETDTHRLIAAAAARLDGVVIENLDFGDVVARYDSEETLFYCDPPYVGVAGYACKFKEEDHRRMQAALSAAKGMAVVSLNDTPFVRELYAAWRIDAVTTTYSVGRDADRAAEQAEVLMFSPRCQERRTVTRALF